MTLPFSTQIKGEPTYFPEKIWACFYHDKNLKFDRFLEYKNSVKYDFGRVVTQLPKKHTIREDKHDRWKPGNLIHFVINNRSKNRFQFAPVINVVNTQKIEIYHTLGYAAVHINGRFFGEIFHHGLDDVYEYTTCLKVLAHNDGFSSIEDFFKWFSTDYKGKIIHWTDLEY